MLIAVVGGGALGSVFAARLATAGHDVALVVRPGRERDTSPITLERASGDGAVTAWAAPRRAVRIPPETRVVLVCVRLEQLDAALVERLGDAPDAPVVVMTPMLPADFGRLREALGDRLVAGMPGVVAYADARGVVRYWLPAMVPTLVDDAGPAHPAVAALVEALRAAGIPTKLEADVHDTNPATTVSFVPLTLALEIAGGIDALLADGPLLALALEGAAEGRQLAMRIGEVALGARVLLRFAGPRALRFGMAIARRRFPEAMLYVETHFGRRGGAGPGAKLHAQNVQMAAEMCALAAELETPHRALDQLRERLEVVR